MAGNRFVPLPPAGTTKRIVTKKLVGRGETKSLNAQTSQPIKPILLPEVRAGKTGPAFQAPKPKFEDSLPKKPNIEAVFTAFQEFMNESRRSIGVSSPGHLKKSMAVARENLQEKLEDMGLAQHIDWTDLTE